MIYFNKNKEEYNKESVYYCSKCLSLAVRAIDENNCYCDKCGCTDINKDSIENWEKLYIERYGKPFVKIIKRDIYGREEKETQL